MADEKAKPINILVVEDEPGHQTLMEKMLARLGYECTIVAGGKEAMRQVLNNDFNAILMDMRIPDIDGYLLTTMLRERGIKTPIIAVTALALHGLDKKAIEAGCNDYLAKPVDIKVLGEVLRKHLSCGEPIT